MKKIILLFFVCFTGVNAMSQSDTTENGEKIFQKIETDPEFPGGEVAWKNYLRQNLNQNVAAENKAPIGSYNAQVRLVVATDGSISELVAESKLGYGMEQEIMKLIRKGPQKWIPATQNGKIIRGSKKITVNFIVIADGVQASFHRFFSSISPNVFHLSIDGIENSKLVLESTNGTVTYAGDDKYFANPTKPGQLYIDVYRKNKKKKNRKKLASLYFQVL